MVIYVDNKVSLKITTNKRPSGLDSPAAEIIGMALIFFIENGLISNSPYFDISDLGIRWEV